MLILQLVTNRQKITAMFALVFSRGEVRGTTKTHQISNFITLRSE